MANEDDATVQPGDAVAAVGDRADVDLDELLGAQRGSPGASASLAWSSALV